MSSLGSGTAKVMIGRVLTMAIAFCTTPIITRLFPPLQYGIVGTIDAYSQWLGAFVCLGYVHAIPLSKNRSEMRSLVLLCALLTLVLLLPTIAALGIFGSSLSGLLNGEGTSQTGTNLWLLLWFIPVLFLIASVNQITTYTFAKERKYAWLNFVEVGTAGCSRATQIALGAIISGTAFVFLLSTVLGSLLTLLAAVYMLVKLLWQPGEDEPVTLKTIVHEHAQFPKVHLWSQVFNFSSLTLSIWLMGALYGFAVVGYYSLSRRLLLLPLMILGASLSRVFYPEASDEYNTTGSVANSFAATMKILLTTCLFPIIAMAAFGPLIFSVAAGTRYAESGVYTQMLAPYMLLILLASPVSTVFLIKRRASVLFFYNVLLIICRPATLAIGSGVAVFSSPIVRYLPAAGADNYLPFVQKFASFGLSGPRIGMLLFSLSGFAIYLHMLYTAMRLGKVSIRNSAALFLIETGRSFATLAPAIVLQILKAPPAAVIAALSLGGAIHYLWLVNREPAIKQRALMALDTASQVAATVADAGRRLLGRSA